MRLCWRLLPLVCFGVLAIFLWRGLSLDPRHLPSAQTGKPVPDFQLQTLTGGVFSSAELQGRVVLLNVWASWCGACVQEQVFLMQLAREGMPIYGLNYKDSPLEALRWLTEWGNPYVNVGADQVGHVAMQLGVYGAPETFLLDKNRHILYRHAGILDESVWKQHFLPRIQTEEGVA